MMQVLALIRRLFGADDGRSMWVSQEQRRRRLENQMRQQDEAHITIGREPLR